MLSSQWQLRPQCRRAEDSIEKVTLTKYSPHPLPPSPRTARGNWLTSISYFRRDKLKPLLLLFNQANRAYRKFTLPTSSPSPFAARGAGGEVKLLLATALLLFLSACGGLAGEPQIVSTAPLPTVT